MLTFGNATEPRTRIPQAAPIWPTRPPMLPAPMIPSVLPCSSVPPSCGLGQCPSRSRRSARFTLRANERSSAKVNSATGGADIPGMRTTRMSCCTA